MNRKKNVEAEDFEMMRKLGFELNGPQDEFSFQPDSGSSIGGIRGKQEYGIDSDFDADGNRAQRQITKKLVRRAKTAGEESASEEFLSPEERIDSHNNLKLSDSDLCSLVSARLHQHPKLYCYDLDVAVKNTDVVIQGRVGSDAAKLLVDEIVEAMPGVTHIYNMVEVQAGL